jgi:gamma-glutamylcyclotransferase (GGCT)/AIG2-like uncharacterized protein YtfP
MRGDLYGVGSMFPAMTDGDGVVTGQLWRAHAPELMPQLFADLDAIEGYREDAPSQSMYLREQRPLITPDGQRAWTYVWNNSTAQLRKIEHGDWRRFKQAERQQVAS